MGAQWNSIPKYQYQLEKLFRFRIVSLKSKAGGLSSFWCSYCRQFRPLTGNSWRQADWTSCFIAGERLWTGEARNFPSTITCVLRCRDRWAQRFKWIKAFIERVKAWYINNPDAKRILWKIGEISSFKAWQPLLVDKGLSWPRKIKFSKRVDDLLKNYAGRETSLPR